ncbi:MAG: hypothetical protein QGH83_03745, partial [Candidatus Pacebacteria bacterium]|nr:hypothetical protein [Candidatus Paceibacterota bacterium]
MKLFTFKKILPSVLIIAVLATGIFSAFEVNTVNAITNNPPATVEITENYSLSEGVNIRKATGPDGKEIKPSDRKPGDTLPKGTIVNTYKNDINKFGSSGKLLGTVPGGIGLESEKGDTKSCTWYWWTFSGCFKAFLAWAGETTLEFFGFIVGISGSLLNVAVDETVLKMGKNIGEKGIGPVVEKGWKVFRDLANIIIIFALLFIGIATILRLENYGVKKLLGTLIIVALLINFSLFFTRVIIDSSNLLAVQFYNKVESSQAHLEGKEGNFLTGWSGFSDSYMQALKLSTLYSKNDFSDITQGLNTRDIFLITTFGSILFLVSAFTFLAGAFLLVIRYVALIFLMILSPLAFVGMILPKTQKLAGQWWSELFKYAFFAPIFFLLSWFVIEIINSSAFQNSIGLFGDNRDEFSALTAVDTFQGSIPLVLNFVIVIVFVIASLIIAQKLGLYGSDAVMKWGGSARKWGQGVVGGATFGMGGRILRNTAGRGASKWADSEGLKTKAAKGGIFGTFARTRLRGLRGVAGSSFDARATKAGGAIGLGKSIGKGGYQEKLKQQVKSQEKFAGSLVEVKRSSVDRIKEKNIRDNIQKATKSL